MEFTIQLTETADADARQRILASLLMYNAERTGISDYRPLVVLITDPRDTVIGGLWGRTALGWLVTEMLFVAEGLRGKGIGSQLMAQAEQEALARGCHNAWLDTFAFQAAGFSRYYMKKRLCEEAGRSAL
jgi:GNAT superfamily N-acetyltransferase